MADYNRFIRRTNELYEKEKKEIQDKLAKNKEIKQEEEDGS